MVLPKVLWLFKGKEVHFDPSCGQPSEVREDLRLSQRFERSIIGEVKNPHGFCGITVSSSLIKETRALKLSLEGFHDGMGALIFLRKN
jgi:hypothetical protein